MTRFVVDNQLPAAVAFWLRAKGCAADHVLELGLAQAPDAEIWLWAAKHSAIIITKDEDFAVLASTKAEPVKVVWLRMGNSRTAPLLQTLEKTWSMIKAQLESDSRVIEIL